MNVQLSEIHLRGKTIKVPSVTIEGKTVVVTGRWLRHAVVRGEDWTEGPAVAEPRRFIALLKESGLEADVFSFAQKIPDVRPRHHYHVDWDNMAAIPITCYDEWWERISSDMRRDVKIAARRGVHRDVKDDCVRCHVDHAGATVSDLPEPPCAVARTTR